MRKQKMVFETNFILFVLRFPFCSRDENRRKWTTNWRNNRFESSRCRKCSTSYQSCKCFFLGLTINHRHILDSNTFDRKTRKALASYCSLNLFVPFPSFFLLFSFDLSFVSSRFFYKQDKETQTISPIDQSSNQHADSNILFNLADEIDLDNITIEDLQNHVRSYPSI